MIYQVSKYLTMSVSVVFVDASRSFENRYCITVLLYNLNYYTCNYLNFKYHPIRRKLFGVI